MAALVSITWSLSSFSLLVPSTVGVMARLVEHNAAPAAMFEGELHW